jgi:long-chain acyl-CoA synthetase
MSARWSREVVDGVVNGHPCRVYAQRPRSLGELVLDAQRWGERPFLVQGERRLSGDQHAQAVARVAQALRARGVQAGQRVMLLGYNHIEWLVSFWALQCCGATAVLGNAWWSDEETGHAIAQAQPALVITDRGPDRALPADTPRLAFAELRPLVEAGEPLALELAQVPEDAPALVLFSSGTTGQAKGVLMSHRGVIANIQNLLVLQGRLPTELPAEHPGTVSLMTMPLFHLAGIQVSFMTLLSGGKLVFTEGRFDPLQVLRLIEAEKVRAWGAVPTMVARVIHHEDFGRFDTGSVASIPMGGAAIPHELRAEIAAAFPKTAKRVGSMYGLTEAGGVLAAGSGAELEGRPNCVGKPLASVEVRIRQPDAQGVGEIVARTPTATLGYLGEADAVCDEEGWIASGDLGRFDEDGFLYVVGRSKDTIIRGGENIASQHVERCLRMHPAVLEAAVVPLPHADLGEEVGAAIVLREGVDASVEELEQHAKQHLARFEVPTRWWLRRDALPTNASGKVVKRELVADWPAPPAARGVLHGIRVLDLTQMVAGPLCTMMLGDLGAEVVKVEPPEGDSSRQIGRNRPCGESDYFLSVNRNKRSIVLDLKTEQGRATLQALAAHSDVVVENFRPGTMERLGIGYETLRAANPALVYCALSGFGQDGAYRDRPALDPVIQAMSGVMQLTGTQASGPLKTGMLISDFVPPLFGAIGILGALYARRDSGLGQRVDVSMLDATVFSMVPREGYFFSTGKTPERLGNAHYQLSPWNTYATADGRHVMVVAHTEKFWRALAQATGCEDLLADARFAGNGERLRNRQALDQRLAAAFAAEPLSTWTARLEAAGVLFAPVRDFEEVFEDPVVRQMVEQVEHPSAGKVEVLRNPIRLSANPASIRRPPPLLGEHTEEVKASVVAGA